MSKKEQQARGLRLNNPLCIIKSKDHFIGECYTADPFFKCFLSKFYGLRAAFVIMQTYERRYGCLTVADRIRRWCNDKTTDKYIELVCKFGGFTPYDAVFFGDIVNMIALVGAMARVECGEIISNYELRDAYNAAKKD